MAPFAGVIFLIVCFYMLTSRFKADDSGIVSERKMAYSASDPPCFSETYDALVSLNEKNQLSFSVNSEEIRTASIQKVAAQHNIFLNASQKAALKTLSFLATDVENLSTLLSLSENQRNKLIITEKVAPLSELELLECIAAARAATAAFWHKPVYISLQIAAETKASQIRHLTDLLQAQGTNRFKLLTLRKKPVRLRLI